MLAAPAISATFVSDNFVDAELAAAADSEYRGGNRAFRNQMIRTIGGVNDHPLRFLLNSAATRFFRQSRNPFLVDAGHIIPVKTLRQRGTTLERLAVQSRTLNRSQQARPLGTIYSIMGVPVDHATVQHWAQLHPPFAAWWRAHRRHPSLVQRSRGWTWRSAELEVGAPVRVYVLTDLGVAVGAPPRRW